MTEQEYRSNPAISRSELFKISKSPLHFKWYKDHPDEPTPALIFGQAFHKFILEAESFNDEFAVAPNIDRRTKDGRESWANFQAASEGKTIVKPEDFDVILDMEHALAQNELAQVMLLNSKHEVPYFWTDELTGEDCKCRADMVLEIPGQNIIADLKTCVSAAPDDFNAEIMRYGYDLQAYMYSEGVKANTGKDWRFVFIAIEKKPPYAINITEADEEIFESGLDRFREYIGIYHECKQTGNWYGYNGFKGIVNKSHLPAWRAKDFE